MARYKCSVCGIANVSENGGVCFKCSQGAGQAYDDFGRPISPEGSCNGARPCAATTTSRSAAPLASNGKYTDYDEFGRPTYAGQQGNTPAQRPVNTPARTNWDVAQPETEMRLYASSTAPRNGIAGIISNYRETIERTNALARWVLGLLTWTPFCGGKEKRNFILNAESGQCFGVEMRGTISNGAIYDNISVRLYGRRNARGTIHANRVEVMETGEIIQPNVRIHPGIMWLLTLSVVGLMILLVCSASTVLSGQPTSKFMSYLGLALIGFAAILFVRSLLRRKGRNGGSVLLLSGILLGVVLYFVAPQLLVSIITLVIAIYLVTKMFTIK